LHKAKTFMLESRVNAVHAATLISLGMLDEAEELFKAGITSVEAVAALRLINALNFRKVYSLNIVFIFFISLFGIINII
uniref:Pentatricopeptide repeat-containing protein n=1 Tax=Anisakis simplex TaxID=6269 RepID=A0A0M3JF40_ANISI